MTDGQRTTPERPRWRLMTTADFRALHAPHGTIVRSKLPTRPVAYDRLTCERCQKHHVILATDPEPAS